MKPASRSLTPPQLAALAGRHAHDVRNVLNGLELEVTVLEDLAADPEAADSIARLRAGFAQITAQIRDFTAKLVPEPRLPLTALDLIERWQRDAAGLFPRDTVTWQIGPVSLALELEPALVRGLLSDLLAVAVRLARGKSVQVAVADAAERLVIDFSASEATAGPAAGLGERFDSFWEVLVALAASQGGSLTTPDEQDGETRARLPFRLELPNANVASHSVSLAL